MIRAQSGDNNVSIVQGFRSGVRELHINTQDVTFRSLAGLHSICLAAPPFSSDNSPLINDAPRRWHQASLEELVNTSHMFSSHHL